jgi:hypothetical protein
MTLSTKTGLAALAGLLMLAASPVLAQQSAAPQNQTQAAPGSTAPAAGQAMPNSTAAPADQTSPAAPGASGQTMPGSAQSTTSPASNAPATMSASAESLSHVKDAKTTLASASVQDSSGQQVGQVSTVHTSKHGTATKVDITLSSAGGSQAKTISVSASKLRYDPNSNTLITDLSSTDLQAMPAASSSSM